MLLHVWIKIRTLETSYKNELARLGHHSFAGNSLVSAFTYFTWSGLHDLTLSPPTPPEHGDLFALRLVDVFLPSRAWEVLQRFLKCLLKYSGQLYIIFFVLAALISQVSPRDFLTKVLHTCIFSESVLYETSDESFIELLKILLLFNTI